MPATHADPAILAPAFALAAWTMCVLLLMAFRRLGSVGRGEVTPGDFRYGESAQVPAAVSLPNRNYMNLLELPILFYAICAIAYASQAAGPLAVELAWAYAGLRVAHTLVHIAYNNVMHRFAVFAASNFALIGLWVVVGLKLWG